MAEWWKLKREIKRFGLQISELRTLVQGPVNRLYYDRFKRREIRLTQGDQSARENVAIILIYQPEGVLPSVIQQLDHFLEKDVVPIIVSNAPLHPSDRAVLSQKCLFILERPNFGYDFGGYRDGVLEVLNRGLKIENLFLLNDSIWFPIWPDCTFLDTAKQAPADIFGVFYSTKSKKRSHWHLQSYFYRFGRRLIESPEFACYWTSMPLYNGSKRIVIRQFESKLTASFLAKGFTADSLFNKDDVRRETLALDNDHLVRLIAYNTVSDPLSRSIFRAVEGLTPADDGWRMQVQKLVEHSKFATYFLNAHPWVFLDGLRSPILKKNREEKFVNQRREMFALGLDAKLTPQVREEARARDQESTGSLRRSI